MALHYYTHYSKEKIKTASSPFASGGEGKLYRIASPRSMKGQIVKLYHQHKNVVETIPKLQYLIEHADPTLRAYAALPTDLVLNRNQEVVGIIMPFFNGEKLELFCQPNQLEKLGIRWKRLNINTKKGEHNRLFISFYLAALIARLHHTQNYIVVDLKAENLLINPSFDLFMVDVDSVQIKKDNQLLHRAPMVTVEYAPPEYHMGDEIGQIEFKAHWDNFALAVILYRLLTEIHPYAASSLPPYDSIVNLHGKVEKGLFVHRPSLKETFSAIPNLHGRFYDLPESIQKLFMQCFVEGHDQPEKRPTAIEWATALYGCIGRYHNGEQLLQHLFFEKKPVLSTHKPLDLVAKRWEFYPEKRVMQLMPLSLNPPNTILEKEEDSISLQLEDIEEVFNEKAGVGVLMLMIIFLLSITILPVLLSGEIIFLIIVAILATAYLYINAVGIFKPYYYRYLFNNKIEQFYKKNSIVVQLAAEVKTVSMKSYQVTVEVLNQRLLALQARKKQINQQIDYHIYQANRYTEKEKASLQKVHDQFIRKWDEIDQTILQRSLTGVTNKNTSNKIIQLLDLRSQKCQELSENYETITTDKINEVLEKQKEYRTKIKVLEEEGAGIISDLNALGEQQKELTKEGELVAIKEAFTLERYKKVWTQIRDQMSTK